MCTCGGIDRFTDLGGRYYGPILTEDVQVHAEYGAWRSKRQHIRRWLPVPRRSDATICAMEKNRELEGLMVPRWSQKDCMPQPGEGVEAGATEAVVLVGAVPCRILTDQHTGGQRIANMEGAVVRNGERSGKQDIKEEFGGKRVRRVSGSDVKPGCAQAGA